MSCNPANDASALSSTVADDRTATSGVPPSAAYPSSIAAATPGGSGASAMMPRKRAANRAIPATSPAGRASIPARSAPSGSSTAMAAVNAPAVTANPGGTATPALASSPRDAAFPPTVPASAAPASVTTKVT